MAMRIAISKWKKITQTKSCFCSALRVIERQLPAELARPFLCVVSQFGRIPATFSLILHTVFGLTIYNVLLS